MVQLLLADVDVTTSIQRGLNELFAFIPEFLAAIAILIIGWIVAKAIGRLIGRALHRAGMDRALHEGPGGSWIRKVTMSPSRLVATIAKWAIFLGAVSLAVSVLGIGALSTFVGRVFAYLPNIIAAVLIFLVAGAVAAGVATLVGRTMGDTGLGKILSTAVPVLIMAVAGFMILEQLEVAPEIVRITYAAILGAVALGFALAFGLGGRDVAARMLEGAYQTGVQRKEEFRRDLNQGMTRAKTDVDRARAAAGSDVEPTFEPDPLLEGRVDRPR
jgi:hypothetical protein